MFILILHGLLTELWEYFLTKLNDMNRENLLCHNFFVLVLKKFLLLLTHCSSSRLVKFSKDKFFIFRCIVIKLYAMRKSSETIYKIIFNMTSMISMRFYSQLANLWILPQIFWKYVWYFTVIELKILCHSFMVFWKYVTKYEEKSVLGFFSGKS